MSMKLQSLFLVSCLTIFLVACSSSDDPDDPAANPSRTLEFEAVALDGFVAGGLVYWDSNENRLLDSWEPYAFTDNDGYFTRSRIQTDGSRIDYCDDAADAIQQQFCLRVVSNETSGLIRLVGGFDVFSGEPFNGSLTLRTSFSQSADNVPVLSPISTLLAQIDAPLDSFTYTEEAQRLLLLFGLEEQDAQVNFLEDVELSNQVNNTVYEVALQIHKTLDVMSGRLKRHYSMIGEEADLPVDAGSFLYRALYDRLETVSNIAALDANFYVVVLNDAEAALRELLVEVNATRREQEDSEFVIPDPLADTEKSRSAMLADQVSGFVNDLFTAIANSASSTTNQARALQRALDVVVGKSVDEPIQQNDPSISAAVNLALAAGGTTPTEQQNYLDMLGDANSDISGLIDDDYSDSSAVVTRGTTTNIDLFNPDNVETTLPLAGTKMRLSGREVSSNKTSLVDVLFYFQGALTATRGDLVMCATYQEAIGVDNDDDLDKDYFTGSWQLLSSLNDSTVEVRVSVAGGEFSLVIKSIGMVAGEPKYRFNFQGDLRDFDGLSTNTSITNTSRIFISQTQPGVIDDSGNVPTSSSDCALAMGGAP